MHSSCQMRRGLASVHHPPKRSSSRRNGVVQPPSVADTQQRSRTMRPQCRQHDMAVSWTACLQGNSTYTHTSKSQTSLCRDPLVSILTINNEDYHNMDSINHWSVYSNIASFCIHSELSRETLCDYLVSLENLAAFCRRRRESSYTMLGIS